VEHRSCVQIALGPPCTAIYTRHVTFKICQTKTIRKKICCKNSHIIKPNTNFILNITESRRKGNSVPKNQNESGIDCVSFSLRKVWPNSTAV
jgi:hypothetical protein